MDSDWSGELKRQLLERRDPWVLLEDREAVDAAIGGWWEVPGVLVSEDSEWRAPIWSGLESQIVSREDFEKIPGIAGGAQVLGLAKIPQETGEIAKFLTGLPADALVVVCPRLDNEEDAGTIVRTAAAMGVAGVLFGAEGVSPFARGAVRASEGAIFRLPVRVGDGGLLLRSLKAARFEMLADDPVAGAAAEKLPASEGRRALIISGGSGLGFFWAAGCDRRITAGLSEGSDSSKRCGALLWELTKARED